MIKEAQVRKLRQFLGEGHPFYRAALKVGMDAESARKYRHADRLPSESLTPDQKRGRTETEKGTQLESRTSCVRVSTRQPPATPGTLSQPGRSRQSRSENKGPVGACPARHGN